MSALTVHSPNTILNTGFSWAKRQALGYVRTGHEGEMPCYWAGLLDREAIYIRDFAHQALGAHVLGLAEENFAMLKAFAATMSEAQQWYPAWAITFDGEIFHMDYHHATDFPREIPMAFELVETGYRLYRWTGNAEYITDPVLWNYYTHVVTDFISAHDGYGHGVASEWNSTGWPFDGISTYNEGGERIGEAGDAIASQYQALCCYAAMQTARGELNSAQATTARTDALRQDFDTRWWSEAEQQYIRGFTHEGEPRTNFLEMPNIYLASKFLTTPGMRNDHQLDLIEQSVDYTTQRGIEMRTYLPEMFFPYGWDEIGWKRLAYMFETRADYPEISYVALGDIVEGLLGVQANAPEHALATCSHLPVGMPWLEVEHIPLGAHDLTIRHEGNTTTLTHLAGPNTLTWEAQFPGEAQQICVNGVAQEAVLRDVHGRAVSAVSVEVPVGASVTVRHG